MNIISKIISFIKNIFNKQEEVKKLTSYSEIKEENKDNDFLNSLKVTTNSLKKEKKFKRLTCVGDGLGIQKKLNY